MNRDYPLSQITLNVAQSVAGIRPSPDLQEMHFVLQDRSHTMLMPLETLLLCLREAEKQGEVPVLPVEWWALLNCKYPEISQ